MIPRLRTVCATTEWRPTKGTSVQQVAKILGLTILAIVAVSGCGDDNGATGPEAGNYVQVDRMAIPALNTALIPSAKKESFNRSNPAGDVATFKTDVIGLITALRLNVSTRGLGAETGSLTPQALADIIIPDVVTINFAQPVTFPNGRDLNDDVIDGVLSLVLNRTVADGVSTDNTILPVFPYLGVPNKLPKPGL